MPDALKAQVEAQATALIEGVLKPACIEPPPKDERFNYLIDITTRWHGAFFYFIAAYASPGPNAISPTFESPFTRLEFAGQGRFHLEYMRHTGKWCQVYPGVTLDDALQTIRDEGLFQPA